MELGRGYALRDGKLVHISELTKNLRGKNCGCQCPGCKEPVLARMGEKNRHHFAHIGIPGSFDGTRTLHACNSDSVNETITHQMAKEIIEEHGCCYLPEMPILWNSLRKEFPDYDDQVYNYARSRQSLLREEGLVYGTVELEQAVATGRKRIIPDVIIITDKGAKILVEIAVFHKITAEKYEKITDQGLAVVEFDCQNIGLDPDMTESEQVDYLRKTLTDILIHGKSGANTKRRWVNHGNEFSDYAVRKASKILVEVKEEVEKKRLFANTMLSAKKQAEYVVRMKADYALEIQKKKKDSYCLQKYPELIDCIGVPIPYDQMIAEPREIWQLRILDDVIREANISTAPIRDFFLSPSFYEFVSDPDQFRSFGYWDTHLPLYGKTDALRIKVSICISEYYIAYLFAALNAKKMVCHNILYDSSIRNVSLELDPDMMRFRFFSTKLFPHEFLQSFCENLPDSPYAYKQVLSGKAAQLKEEYIRRIEVEHKKEQDAIEENARRMEAEYKKKQEARIQSEKDEADRRYAKFAEFGFSAFANVSAKSILERNFRWWILSSFEKIGEFINILPILGESLDITNDTPRYRAHRVFSLLMGYNYLFQNGCPQTRDVSGPKNYDCEIIDQIHNPKFLRESSYRLKNAHFFHLQQIFYVFSLLGLINEFTVDLSDVVYTNQAVIKLLCPIYDEIKVGKEIVKKLDFIKPICEKHFHKPEQGAKEVVYALLYLKYHRIEPEDCPFREFYFDNEPLLGEYLYDIHPYIAQDILHKHKQKKLQKQKRITRRQEKSKRRFEAFKAHQKAVKAKLRQKAETVYTSTLLQTSLDPVIEKIRREMEDEQRLEQEREALRLEQQRKAAEEARRPVVISFWANRIETKFRNNSSFSMDFIDLDIRFNKTTPPEYQEFITNRELFYLVLLQLEKEGKLKNFREDSNSFYVSWNS